jgi:hypothetical protein
MFKVLELQGLGGPAGIRFEGDESEAAGKIPRQYRQDEREK